MLFDCEEWMLEIKLNEVGHMIDHFIIVEGRYSLQNTIRTQCFPNISKNNANISKWLYKITYIYDTQPIVSFKYWEAEVYYRDQIGLQGLATSGLSLQDDDLIIVSDVDELLTDRFLHLLKWNEGFPTLIEASMLWSYYSFYWINPNVAKQRMISSAKELRELGGNRTNAIRFNLYGAANVWRPPEIVGWHCSWCMPTAQFPSKTRHFAHSQLNTEQNNNLTYLADMRARGLWFPDQQANACIQSRLQLPSYVRENLARYPALAGLF